MAINLQDECLRYGVAAVGGWGTKRRQGNRGMGRRVSCGGSTAGGASREGVVWRPAEDAAGTIEGSLGALIEAEAACWMLAGC